MSVPLPMKVEGGVHDPGIQTGFTDVLQCDATNSGSLCDGTWQGLLAPSVVLRAPFSAVALRGQVARVCIKLVWISLASKSVVGDENK